MNCQKCKEEMEFEELKNFHGYFYCPVCEYEIVGSQIPVSDGDRNIEYEEKTYEN